MHNLVARFLDEYAMVQPGDTVWCAVSGGADSVALLWAMYLLQEKRGFCLKAAHFNHHLRAEESDRDEAFVRSFCGSYDIPLTVGHGSIIPGAKGLEAAAREARYRFFETLPGKVATAHTADDNTETVLMHLIRGTGLRGLGGIAPVRGKYIRPLLSATRCQVESYLQEYHLRHITDSSNETDDFLRNRLRHRVLPLLLEENPRLMENTSFMARQLRLDEAALTPPPPDSDVLEVALLRTMSPPQQVRYLTAYLARLGIQDPTAGHVDMLQRLITSADPSARAHLPGGVIIGRSYETIAPIPSCPGIPTVILPREGSITLQQANLTISCEPARTVENNVNSFAVCPKGQMVVRSRLPGDKLRLSGGTKSLKKLFIDRKIPAHHRDLIPVIADEEGILGVAGIGVNLDRAAISLPAIRICTEYTLPRAQENNGGNR